jgi:hypothetical protein
MVRAEEYAGRPKKRIFGDPVQSQEKPGEVAVDDYGGGHGTDHGITG